MSLRARLLIGMIGSFTLLLAAFGVIIGASIEYSFVREFDFYLETVARTLAASAEVHDSRIEVKLVPEALSDIPQVEGELFSQYWSDDGAVLAKSTNLADQSLPYVSGADGHPNVQPFVLSDGRRARAAGMRFAIHGGVRIPGGSTTQPSETEASLTVVVARDTTDLESHVRFVRWLLLAAGAGTMTVGAVVSVVVIGRSLRPLHDVAAAIAAIKEGDLGATIAVTALPEEIVPLVQRLNELLRRLDDAFARERALTADVAHELRTPVAGILSTAGVTLSAERTPAEYQSAMEDVREVARRMRWMIENLLALARLDSQPAQFHFESVELRDLVEFCWIGCRGKAAARRLCFANEIPDGMLLSSDRNALAMVFTNLLENAVEYANESGRIRVICRKTDGVDTIDFANSGCQLTEAQIGRVFDRFWRADPSRKNADFHVGLGLALVRRIVTSLGGTVVACANGGDFVVSVCIASCPGRPGELRLAPDSKCDTAGTWGPSPADPAGYYDP